MGQEVNPGVSVGNFCRLYKRDVEFCLLWDLGLSFWGGEGKGSAFAAMHTATGAYLNSYMRYCLIEVTIG